MAAAPQVKPGDAVYTGAGSLDERMKLIAYTLQKSVQDPWAHEFVSALVRDLPPKDDMAELHAIFNRLKWPNIRYQFHPRGLDRFQTLRRTITMGQADCDVSTVAVNTCAHLLGFKTGCDILFRPGGPWSHIWPIVGFPREEPRLWIPMELTTGPCADGSTRPQCAQFGWEIPHEFRGGWRRFFFTLA